MKITDTLESLLRLLVTTDDDEQVKDQTSQAASARTADRAVDRPLPDWVKRTNERAEAAAPPATPVSPPVELVAPEPEPAPPVIEPTVPETLAERRERQEDDEASVPGLLDSLISWVQSTTQEPKSAVDIEEETEPLPVHEPVVVEPVGFEPSAAEPVVIEPVGFEPRPEPVPEPAPVVEPEPEPVEPVAVVEPEPEREPEYEPVAVWPERVPVPPQPVAYAERPPEPVEVAREPEPAPVPVDQPEPVLAFADEPVAVVEPEVEHATAVEDVLEVEPAEIPGEQLVPVAHDFSHIETAAHVAETLNLGFHLGTAVARIATASTQGSEGVPALREAAWLIERYVAILEKRPVGADLHLTAARLARQGDAIAGLKALAEALDAENAPVKDAAVVEEPEHEHEPVDATAQVVSEPEPDIWGVGRIRRLMPEPPA